MPEALSKEGGENQAKSIRKKWGKLGRIIKIYIMVDTNKQSKNFA